MKKDTPAPRAPQHRLRAVRAATTPYWMSLPSFAAAVLFWVNEWRNKDELNRVMDPRNVIDIRARLRAYWEVCDERSTHAEPNMEEVLASVNSILREAMRVERERLGEIDAIFRDAIADFRKPPQERKPFLASLCGILEAGEPGAKKPPKLVAGRDVRRGKGTKGASHG